MPDGSIGVPEGFPGPRVGDYPKFSRSPHLYLAITQLILGGLCIIFNSAACYIFAMFSVIAIGIWGGIVMMVTGAIGIGAVEKKGRCLVISTLVLSIVSSVLGALIMIFFAIGAFIDAIMVYSRNHRTNHVILDSILAVLGFVELLVAIVQSAFCCKSMSGNHSGLKIVYVNRPPEHIIVQASDQGNPGYPIQPGSGLQRDFQPSNHSAEPQEHTSDHITEDQTESQPSREWIRFED